MKSLINFIIKPVGDRYNNVKNIDGNELLLNTELHNHNYSNRIAKVMSIPTLADTDIKEGDEVIVHHNVFRRFKDIRGNEKNSRSYYKDDIYFATEDQVYAYKKKDKWVSCKGYNFVKPIKETKAFSLDKEKEGVGLKNAAATKKLAIFDAFEILTRIQLEQDILDEKPTEIKEDKAFKGFAEKRSK